MITDLAEIKNRPWYPSEELMEFVNGQVAPYKKLRKIRFIEKMPLFASGKLNRRALIQML